MKHRTPSRILWRCWILSWLALSFSPCLYAADFQGEFSGEARPPEEPLSLWYRRPAKEWVEALAIGNGRLGGMVFGRVDVERIQLNEDTLWGRGPVYAG